MWNWREISKEIAGRGKTCYKWECKHSVLHGYSFTDLSGRFFFKIFTTWWISIHFGTCFNVIIKCWERPEVNGALGSFTSVNRALVQKQSEIWVCFTILPVSCLHAIFVLSEVSEITFTVGYALECAKSQVDEFCCFLGIQVSCAIPVSGRWLSAWVEDKC